MGKKEKWLDLESVDESSMLMLFAVPAFSCYKCIRVFLSMVCMNFYTLSIGT